MPIVVMDYNPQWPVVFERLRARVWPAIADVALGIEHVGSTAVPGLAAKPIIDVTIVVADRRGLEAVIGRLEGIGYRHRGDLGVRGREAFANPPAPPDSPDMPDTPAHHLYACVQGGLALRNHLAVRDRLRRDLSAAAAYSRLKKELARRFADDLDAYIAGKTDFILSLLKDAGFDAAALERIEGINAGRER